jgi:hypothetical protein
MPQTHATALFDFSIDRQDSTVAAKNFLALFNPTASGKIITVGAFFVSYMTTVSSPLYPMRGYRISTLPTGGTAQSQTAICRFDTQRFAPAGLIWTGNPTVGTLGAAIFNVTPGVGQGSNKDQSSMVEQVDAPFGFNPFVLYPGEGVVMRQEAGAVGHLWNLSIIWRELSG